MPSYPSDNPLTKFLSRLGAPFPVLVVSTYAFMWVLFLLGMPVILVLHLSDKVKRK